jgi:hypothetical protein
MSINMLEDIQRVAKDLKEHADFLAEVRTGWGPTRSEHPVRDIHADSIAELARIVQEIVKRLET